MFDILALHYLYRNGIIFFTVVREEWLMKEYFVNDRYRVITCMAKREIMVGDKGIIKLSQQEIADMLKMTKVKVNSIIRELKEMVTSYNVV